MRKKVKLNMPFLKERRNNRKYISLKKKKKKKKTTIQRVSKMAIGLPHFIEKWAIYIAYKLYFRRGRREKFRL
jgi:hypothetical protein